MPPTRRPVESRFVVTDLSGTITTWLDTLVLDATNVRSLNQPAIIDLSVRPNVRRVNGIFTDGYPRLAQSNRLLYHFIHERHTPPWRCRGAGVIMSPEDQGDANVPTSHVVAYDPWQYAMGRPAFINTTGDLPPQDGFLYPATRGGVIVATLLLNAIESEGYGLFIDAGPDYGGTVYWGGVIEDTPVIDYTVQQGTSVGDNWNQLLTAGQDPDGGPGGVDIVLDPIWDPMFRPGYTHELSVYNLAGTNLPGAPQGWGAFNRSSTTADRQHDGTPGAFINVAAFAPGQGTPLDIGAIVENLSSVGVYQPYWQQQWFPSEVSAVAVAAMAQQALSLQKQGKRTFTLAPDPVRSESPFLDYNLGDHIPVITDNSLRIVSSGFQRVQTIPIQVDTNGYTRVSALLTTPDWRGSGGTVTPDSLTLRGRAR
jgi:hypothetical protein